jgi:alpha-tubulin suppressor-like RCC1 family protein
VAGLTEVKTLVGGMFHFCALKNDGTAWCWGSDYYGEAGYGPGRYADAANWDVPRQVASLGSDVTQLAAGNAHTCARKSDATIWCWGNSTWGQLGNNRDLNPSPIQMMGCE